LNAQSIENYFSIDSVSFENENYFLAWSSFSDNGYYKHEYIRKTDSIKGFNKMILIEVLQRDNLTLKEMVTKKTQEIETRKGKDPVANYQVIENEQSGEFLLDFLISEGDLYEWNVYRYKLIDTPKGKAVMLFGYCLRSFEDAELKYKKFFSLIKNDRTELINSVANYEIPKIELIE